MSPLRIGLVFDLLGSAPAAPDAPCDADAEYEPEATIVLLEQAVRRAGAEPVRLGSPRTLLGALGKAGLPRVDAVWNVAEGWATRNREAWAPVLLEMASIPTLGSDALTLSLSLDKAWCKDVLARAGLPVPPQGVFERLDDLEEPSGIGPFPLFVKPRWEGTAKGIRPSSKVEDAAALEREVARVLREYGQPALVEPFLPGPEYTVTVWGTPPRILPVLQRALETGTGIGVHALGRHAPAGGWRDHVPGDLDAPLEANLERLSLRAFAALRCLDFARLDFKLDAKGAPWLLEINPLPSFAPDSSFATHAELEGRPTAELLADVLRSALARLGLVR